jgi:16S rRNA (cytidine1402-2'-O)-methyltransferase
MKQFSNQAFGTLYIVATPIGNMGDITLRAIETLKSVDLVACEDTRVTGGLLSKLDIKKPLKAIHQHSLDKAVDEVINELNCGKNVAYVTDGGTPGISDPGQNLIQNVKIKNQNDNTNINIIPIPGSSAVTAAVSVSGLVDKEFYFAGFLPKKKGRQTELRYLSTIKVPIVIYESAYRIEKTLNDVAEHLGSETEVFIAREITKMFEEYWGGNILKVTQELKTHKLKGEFVLIVKKSKIKSQNDR